MIQILRAEEITKPGKYHIFYIGSDERIIRINIDGSVVNVDGKFIFENKNKNEHHFFESAELESFYGDGWRFIKKSKNQNINVLRSEIIKVIKQEKIIKEIIT